MVDRGVKNNRKLLVCVSQNIQGSLQLSNPMLFVSQIPYHLGLQSVPGTDQ